MKQRTRIIWVPYGYRLKPRAKLKKAVIRQRVPAEPLKATPLRPSAQTYHKEQKVMEETTISQSGSTSTPMDAVIAETDCRAIEEQSHASPKDSLSIKDNDNASIEKKSAREAQKETVEESQVATFDDAFNPYKHYLQDMSHSLVGMPDEAFTRHVDQQDGFTTQISQSMKPARVGTNTTDLTHQKATQLEACRTELMLTDELPRISRAPDNEINTGRQAHTFPSEPSATNNEPSTTNNDESEKSEESGNQEAKRKPVGPHLRKLSGIAPSLMSEKYP